jgi:flagellar biosynthesis protein FlhF
MNVKRFSARSARDALAAVRQALGDDAVVLSTKPCAEGVEILAMAGDSIAQIERVASQTPKAAARPAAPRAAERSAAPAASAKPSLASRAREQMDGRPAPTSPARDESVSQDADQLAMSTLSFQDYVRERMLKKREAALKAEAQARGEMPREMPREMAREMPREMPREMSRETPRDMQREPAREGATRPAARSPASAPAGRSPRREPPVLLDELSVAPRQSAPGHVASSALRSDIVMPSLADDAPSRREQQDMMNELRSMKGLIEERFGALAFMEKLQRQPEQARLTQKLLDAGFSPALVRKLVESMPADAGDEAAWASSVLERNLLTAERQAPIEDQGGVFALIGSTGVGKTTTTAKIAAAFAQKHGAHHLGLITLDAYRVGAHEQLRAYGRILGVPVHIAQDRASLEDLLELLSGKKLILIDTAGVAQRDSRTRELLDMLSHPRIQKLVVVNASAQGETIEDVLIAYRAGSAKGVLLSKIDEAVKLGPALDAMIRHKLSVWGVANGQRVPEDWHRLSAHALVQKAMRSATAPAWRMDANDVSLVFTGAHETASGRTAATAVGV